MIRKTTLFLITLLLLSTLTLSHSTINPLTEGLADETFVRIDGTNTLPVYGEMYNHTDSGNTVSITDITTYFNITPLRQGEVSGMNYTTDSLTIVHNGIYHLMFSVSFGGAGNNEYQIVVKVNDVERDKCEIHRKTGSGGDVGDTAGTCLLNLSTSDFVQLGIKDQDNPANDATLFNANINLMKIDNAVSS